MSRSQTTLGGILLLQALLILFFRSPFAPASQAVEARPLLASLAAITPVRLQLGGSDEESITLEKSGEGWGVTGLAGFPADAKKVDGLLEDLKALTVSRPVVSSPRYHETFGVTEKKNEGRIRLWSGAGDKPELDLIVGDSPNYRITHVRRADDNEVFEARGLTSYEIRSATANWIDKDLVNVPREQLTGLVLTNSNGTFELEQVEGTWKIVAPPDAVGRALDTQKVDDLLRAASALRLADAVGRRDAAAHGLDRPSAVCVVRYTAEAAATQELSVEVGSKVVGNESQRYVGRAGFEFTGSVWESSVKPLLEDKLDDLLAPQT